MRTLLTLLVVCLPLAAQDTTCNSGDYAVVLATNNADVGIAGGAEYNSTSATIPTDYEGGSLDTGTVTFVNAASGDFQVLSGAIETFTFPGALTATTTRKGAVHADGVNIMIQGVR